MSEPTRIDGGPGDDGPGTESDDSGTESGDSGTGDEDPGTESDDSGVGTEEPGDGSEHTDDEIYAEGTALTRLLGDGPKVKILAAFLAEPDLDHNVTDIARLAGVTRKTVYSHLDDLVELGVVKQTRETGGSPRYKLDKDDAAAKKLAELEWELVDRAFGE